MNRPKRRSTSRPRAAGENQKKLAFDYSSKDKGGKPSTKAALPQVERRGGRRGSRTKEEPIPKRSAPKIFSKNSGFFSSYIFQKAEGTESKCLSFYLTLKIDPALFDTFLQFPNARSGELLA